MNNRTSYVLRYGKIVEERWHKVSVGDIVKLKNNDFVAVSITHSFCLFFFFFKLVSFSLVAQRNILCQCFFFLTICTVEPYDVFVFSC